MVRLASEPALRKVFGSYGPILKVTLRVKGCEQFDSAAAEARVRPIPLVPSFSHSSRHPALTASASLDCGCPPTLLLSSASRIPLRSVFGGSLYCRHYFFTVLPPTQHIRLHHRNSATTSSISWPTAMRRVAPINPPRRMPTAVLSLGDHGRSSPSNRSTPPRR